MLISSGQGPVVGRSSRTAVAPATATPAPIDVHPPGADGRQAVEQGAAQGQRSAADHHHDDDEEERDRAVDRRGGELPEQQPVVGHDRAEHALVLDVAAQGRLDDPDAEGAGERPPERAERADERGGQAAQHGEGEGGDAEEQDRGDEHAGHGGERATERPVDDGDPIRRVAERGGGDRVLGGGVGGVAEPRPAEHAPRARR